MAGDDGWRPPNDEIDEARVDEWEIAHPDEALAVRGVFEEGPCYSLALRLFLSGLMEPMEAWERGYLRNRPGDPPPDDAA